MALLTGFSKPPSYPSGRYTRTNPLRREFGLRLLAEPLPEPLRTNLVRAWRRPPRFDGNEAIQSLHRQRPEQARLFGMPPRALSLLTLTELEVARRVVEAPLVSISRETRNKLLAAQGVYFQYLYVALARQVGEAAALSEFERLLLAAR
ncbi:MAG TPA: hypothetical protein VKT82_07500 [Ktedonobacterales bacterium]|nr:hypothetical protein [Ktedonobacterales bacterium]